MPTATVQSTASLARAITSKPAHFAFGKVLNLHPLIGTSFLHVSQSAQDHEDADCWWATDYMKTNPDNSTTPVAVDRFDVPNADQVLLAAYTIVGL